MRRIQGRGYTLLEFIIAVALSMVVLMAVFSMMTSMLRFQVEGLKKSTVTGWSLASIMKMNKEIESAGVLAHPTNAVPSDWVVGCTNWSRILTPPAGGSRADPNLNMVVFYYCYDPATLTMRRLAEESSTVPCPASPVALPACTAAWGGGADQTNDVIAAGITRHSSGALVFARDDSVGGVRLRYAVGEKIFVRVAGKPDVVNPQYVEFDTSITLSRAYLNDLD
ncbi:MAG: prepilin-type N-terminal cleavage/methylation domain-containing protein [Elusimicrobiota bacterium]